jgi:hypothetical protein
MMNVPHDLRAFRYVQQDTVVSRPYLFAVLYSHSSLCQPFMGWVCSTVIPLMELMTDSAVGKLRRTDRVRHMMVCS